MSGFHEFPINNGFAAFFVDDGTKISHMYLERLRVQYTNGIAGDSDLNLEVFPVSEMKIQYKNVLRLQ